MQSLVFKSVFIKSYGRYLLILNSVCWQQHDETTEQRWTRHKHVKCAEITVYHADTL